jgi:hypothetical protein
VQTGGPMKRVLLCGGVLLLRCPCSACVLGAARQQSRRRLARDCRCPPPPSLHSSRRVPIGHGFHGVCPACYTRATSHERNYLGMLSVCCTPAYLRLHADSLYSGTARTCRLRQSGMCITSSSTSTLSQPTATGSRHRSFCARTFLPRRVCLAPSVNCA